MDILKGWFTPKEETSPKKEKTIAPIVQMPVVNYNSNVINTEDTAKYSKILEKALEERNLPGPDFLEFYKTLKTLENQPLPDQQKYVVAFSGLSTMGLTKDKILETSKVYLDTIESEKQEFTKSMNNFSKTEIEDKVNEVAKKTQENIELQKKIQDNINLVAKLNIEVNQNSQRLQSETQSFNVVMEKEKTNIATILTNIKNYL